MSRESLKPFEELSVDQQKVAIDLVVACSLIVTRLPTISQEVFKAIEAEFAAQYDAPANIARYAMRSLGNTMFETEWTCTVTKGDDNVLATHFKQEPESLPGGNGD